MRKCLRFMLKKYSFLVSALIIICGCSPLLMLGDRPVHVSGLVQDEKGAPIKDAIVEFYGVKKTAGEDGRFAFGGNLGARGFSITVNKPGFKQYDEAKSFAFYDIIVTLASISSDKESSGDWHILDKSELENYKK